MAKTNRLGIFAMMGLLACHLGSDHRPTGLDAYSLKRIIRAQQTKLRVCERVEPSSEQISALIDSLNSDRDFLQAVIGLKLISISSRERLLRESRLVHTNCERANIKPLAQEAERKIAAAVVDLADRMADRVPAQEIERKLGNGIRDSP